ncbi:YdeI/OmpD-associated family protein [Algoriphagus sediminis]|uniref:YdeI/OmpD-associated family protein n=1 Tax=Algoriphagus sediminis TaxID=3057113 RepID=A0ABT7YA01_9BACT|nr:YdeI/OmpD-associated family protein [Algoriphagus sediminis]MDN3203342.1 YdeI/OmpD-associated family protein [Algoriphagus sediminis]
MIDHSKIFINSIAELRAWLEKNHDLKESIWLVRWKKGAGKNYVSYSDIVDELLCFGWVDSLPRKLNEEQTMIRISPRNPRSNWSKINKEKAERLIKTNRMEKAGFTSIKKAKENGSWDFLDDVEALIIPHDLKIALKEYPEAERFFKKFPKSSKRGILKWIKSAKTDSTRQKRIRQTAEKAALNIKANHPKGRDKGPV